MQLSVKNVEENVFRDFKAESVREKLHLGKALTLAMRYWLQQQKRIPKRSLLDFKPRRFGKGTERLSEQIDEVLYS